jgi:cell division septum initiation protein DivIVA
MSIADLENEIEALQQAVAALKQRADESDAKTQQLISMVKNRVHGLLPYRVCRDFQDTGGGIIFAGRRRYVLNFWGAPMPDIVQTNAGLVSPPEQRPHQ